MELAERNENRTIPTTMPTQTASHSRPTDATQCAQTLKVCGVIKLCMVWVSLGCHPELWPILSEIESKFVTSCCNSNTFGDARIASDANVCDTMRMIEPAKTRKMGRPRAHGEVMAVTIPIRLPPEILTALDEIIAVRFGAPSRNAIIREMIMRGLEVERATRVQPPKSTDCQ